MAKFMIYCDLLERNENFVIYSFYSKVGKRGKIKFPLYTVGQPTILEVPEFSSSKYDIEKLYFKYYKDFLNGKTPEKIAYEY
jgi:hypothetical protein